MEKIFGFIVVLIDRNGDFLFLFYYGGRGLGRLFLCRGFIIKVGKLFIIIRIELSLMGYCYLIFDRFLVYLLILG